MSDTGQATDVAASAANVLEAAVSNENAQGQQGTSNEVNAVELLKEVGKTPDINTLTEGLSEHAKAHLKGMDPADVAKFAPKLTEWDKNANARIAKEIEKTKAYEGLDPQEARDALELQKLIFSNPKEALARIQAMADNVEYQEPATQTPVEDDEEFDIDSLPKSIKDRLLKADKIDDLENAVKHILGEKQQILEKQQRDKDWSELSSKLDALEARPDIGKFDRNWVLKAIAVGDDPEDAAKSFRALVDSAVEARLSAHNNAPTLLGGRTGSIAAEAGTVDVAKLGSKDTVKLVANLLKAQNEANS